MPLRPYQKPEKKRRDYWYLAFGVLFASTESTIVSQVLGLVNGSLTPNQFGAVALQTLQGSHTQAYVYGANSTAVTDLAPADTQPYIDQVVKEQGEFLHGFIDEIEDKDPRYVKTLEELYPEIGTEEEIQARIKNGDLTLPALFPDSGSEYYDEKAIQHRMRLYVERLRGTANWGAVDMLAPWEPIKWIDDKGPHECSDCRDLAKKDYRKDTLPTVPGGGATKCGVNCHCELQLEDGTVIQF